MRITKFSGFVGGMGGTPTQNFKLGPNLLPVSADFALLISLPFGLPPLGLLQIGLPLLDSDHAKCCLESYSFVIASRGPACSRP